jgi:hypothetical protein
MLRRRAVTFLTCLVAGLPAGLATVPDARAHTHPAAHALPVRDAFYPTPPPSPEYMAALDGQLAAARSAGFPLKVAIIASETDLGALAVMFDHPENYALALRTELGPAKTRIPLLVVMPKGMGIADFDDTTKVAWMTPDASNGPDGLVRSAMEAVTFLASGEGKTIPVPPVTVAQAPGSGGHFLLFLGPLLLLGAMAGGAALLGGRQRRREAGGGEGSGGDRHDAGDGEREIERVG